MKIGGGLNYVTGPMGSGKSLYGVRRITDSLISGKYVVTNIELREDALEKIARHFTRPFGGEHTRSSLVARFANQYIFTTDLGEAKMYRLPGKGEGRGTIVWDESHNDLNNRDWREADNRAEILKWATQLRKLGFQGYLLSQHGDNTDVALRRIVNFSIRLQNQREQTRVMGVRITPWPLFLAAWYPAHVPLRTNRGGGMEPVRVERYFLGWHRHLYDTFGIFHDLDSVDSNGDSLIHLPEIKAGQKRGAISRPSDPHPVLVIASPSSESRKPTSPALPPTSENAA